MKLIQMCMALAIATGVAAAPHVARAQALGEAATLSAGVSSAGSGSGSALGHSIGRAMGTEGRHVTSSSKASTSGGVITLHWSRQELKRSEKTSRTAANHKTRTGTQKAQPDFVIFGADPQNSDSNSDSDGAPASQPKTTTTKSPR